tara:strand:+ start:441 stop:830 length:390 start_codon:yes stop_codon:yes gene_type:complete
MVTIKLKKVKLAHYNNKKVVRGGLDTDLLKFKRAIIGRPEILNIMKPHVLTKGCDIQLFDQNISRKHCEIKGEFIRDLNSKNGTYVGLPTISKVVRLEPGEWTQIQKDTMVYFGPPNKLTHAKFLIIDV